MADFNRDGMFDLIYARPETQEIVVLLNQLKAQDVKSVNLCSPELTTKAVIFSEQKEMAFNVGTSL